MERCVSYEPKFYEYLVPSPVIFTKQCLSYDRTELFIVSSIRLILWMVIYFLFRNIISMNNTNNTNNTDNKTNNKMGLIDYIFIAIFGINILYIGGVVSKVPTFSVGSGETISLFESKSNTYGDIKYSL